MNQFGNTTYSQESIDSENKRFITKVYGWMSMALAITALVAMQVASSPVLIQTIVRNRLLFFGLIIGELILVGYLAGAIKSMSAKQSTLVFLGYAALNGLTFSVVFLLYTAESIASTFFITAGMFGAMSVYGWVTKKDLTKMGSLLMMGVIGLIIASLVNIFLKSEMIYWITSCIGVAIFTGLVAYDTQKIKNMNIIGNEGTEEDHKESIIGALHLYLDFINLFLFLLRFFGKRK